MKTKCTIKNEKRIFRAKIRFGPILHAESEFDKYFETSISNGLRLTSKSLLNV